MWHLLLPLIAALAGDTVHRTTRRVARVSALFALAIVFLGIGIIGLSLAAFLLLARLMDPIIAALLIGSLFCLFGAVLMLLARTEARYRQPLRASPELERARQDLTALMQVGGAPVVLVPAILAVVAGYIWASRKR